MSKVLPILYRQILCFPALAIAIVAVTYICGGVCGLWQWWLAVSIIVLLGFAWGERRVATSSAVAFCVILGLYWLICNLCVTAGPFDTIVYHNPAIRLLSAGWNPVYESTPETIAAATGIDSTWFRVWHVLSMPKATWYFSALAYKFHGNAFNLLFALYPWILFATACQIWSFLGSAHWGWKILATLFAIGVAPSFTVIVDSVAALAMIGLLLTIWRILRGYEWDWLALFIFSFWLCVAKQTSAMHCAVVWIALSIFALRTWAKAVRLFLLGLGLLAVFVVVNVSPYITQYKNYGHPLYPCYTVDDMKNPKINIVGVFDKKNDDAREMGHFGSWLYAYTSSSAVASYYKWKLERPSFRPSALWWSEQMGSSTPQAPVPMKFRMFFWSVIALVFIFGTATDRKVLIITIACMLAVPTGMLGYLRYVPWSLWGCILLVRLASIVNSNVTRRIIGGALAAIGGVTICGTIFLSIPWRIDDCYSVRKMLSATHPQKLYCPSFYDVLDNEREPEATYANVLLMKRQVPDFDHSEVVRVPQTRSSAMEYEKTLNRKQPFLSDCYIDELNEYSEWRRLSLISSKTDRYKAYPGFILKTWFITLPKSIAMVICDAFGGSK